MQNLRSLERQESVAIEFTELSRTDATDLQALYRLYETSFPHPDEREPLEAIEYLLVINEDVGLQKKFGPYKEFVIAIRRADTHEIIGGLVMGVTSSPEHLKNGFLASIQAIYYFLDKPYRGLIPIAAVLREMRTRALQVFPPPADSTEGDIAIFFEVNNPEDMTADDIEQDYDNSGLDTYRRYSAYLHFSKPLDFNYIQPALDSSKKAVEFLDLFYIGKSNWVPSGMLLRHLYSFVSLSVLKGHDAHQNEDFARMASQLGGRATIPVISPRNEVIARIKAEAKWRAEAAWNRDRVRLNLHPPQIREEMLASKKWILRNILGRAWNGLYRIVYKLYHRLERHHVTVAYLECFLGLLGFFFFLYNLNESIRNGVDFMNILKDRMHVEEMLKDGMEMFIILFLSLYLASRGLVQTRRSHLGYGFKHIWKQWRHFSSPTAEGCEQGATWLHQKLERNVQHLTGFGSIIRADVSDIQRISIRSKVANYSAQLYSERVWGVVDIKRRDWELKMLTGWLDQVPDGLMAATFDHCPDRIFYSVVLPIKVPGILSRLDLESIEIDTRYARILKSGRPADAVQSDDIAEPWRPCLLVLRHMVSDGGKGTTRVPESELEFGLILTILLHLTTLLEKIAKDGNLVTGLPDDCTILCVSAHMHGNRLLGEWLGFRLLQRPSAHEGFEGDDENLGQSNLSIYSLALGRHRSLALAGQRLLGFMSRLQAALRNSPAARR